MVSTNREISAVSAHVVKIESETDTRSDDSRDVPNTDYYLHRSGIVYSANFEQTLVKIELADGTHGWGEVQAPVVPEVPAVLIENFLGPLLIGKDPGDVEYIWELMYNSMNVRGHFLGFMIDAMAGIDIALWDAKGKLLEEPVVSLLGGNQRDTLSAYATGPDDPQTFLESGFSGVKVGHVTSLDEIVALDIDFDRFDPSSVYVDHHWGLASAAEAIALGRKLEEFGVGFVEAPLTPEDIDGAARVSDTLDVPVALGESLRTTHDFKIRLDRDAFDVGQPDVNRTGLTEGKRIANLLDAHNRPIAPHVGGSLGIAMAATWHLSAAVPNFLVQEHQHARMEASNQFLQPALETAAGELVVPDSPGLGVDVDETELEKFVTDTYLTTS